MTKLSPLQGFKALVYVATQLGGVIPRTLDGKGIEKLTDGNGNWRPECYVTDEEELLSLWEGRGNRRGAGKGTPIKRFSFSPKKANLLALDIDIKGGEDGLKSFYEWLDKHLGNNTPKWLKDLWNYSFYTKTPSGGLHVYFDTEDLCDDKLFANGSLCNGVEIKHKDLTAPGSCKIVDGKEKSYMLYGDLIEARFLPSIIAENLKEKNDTQRQIIKQPRLPSLSKPKTKHYESPSSVGYKAHSKEEWIPKTLDELFNDIADKAVGNDRRLGFSRRVLSYRNFLKSKNKDTVGYELEDVIAYEVANLCEFSNKAGQIGKAILEAQIKSTVKGARLPDGSGW